MGQIENALISVADKTGLVDFSAGLVRFGIKILATSGTASFLKQNGIDCTEISAITGSSDYLGGLVKTLHHGIHLGILASRDDSSHMEQLKRSGFPKIDMVVVNFYPLKRTKERSLDFIDIGGPAMARAAAKNFRSALPIPHPRWYQPVLAELEKYGEVSSDLRWQLALETLIMTSAYDCQILDGVGMEWIGRDRVILALKKQMELRYGENPHQKAYLYGFAEPSGFEVLKGELSYNNILDIDCCIELLRDLEQRAAVVVKHAGPCGVAESDQPISALESAYGCDPVSAYGGVIGVNFKFDEECASFVAKKFVECIVAPDFDTASLKLLEKKKTRLVKTCGDGSQWLYRSALSGMLIQSKDSVLLDDLEFVSGDSIDARIIEDLKFAWKVVKHVKSNAIVLARNRKTIGIGGGQPSRIDSTRIAIMKAVQAGHSLDGSVMASDGFFPFPDCIELAHKHGICAVIQPGGSIRDKEVIERAKELSLIMALTRIRHFRH